MQFEKVENVKRPLRLGELFLVPCFIKKERSAHHINEHDEFSQNDNVFITAFGNVEKLIIEINPVILHAHNDIENGQIETHYHLDYRFIKIKKSTDVISSPVPIISHSTHRFGTINRPIKDYDRQIEYFVLPVVNENFYGITPASAIKNSKIKHKCIHKGKCPHRGYDLSQVPIIHGKIICPLHGLEFNSENKILLTDNNLK